ncbi:sugar nucleotide-binding protein [Clostridium sp. MCC353]|uniref:SDR family oxidoreductase n=1 Tax=Clostridium sp. MCC353 TaxID=2592646 RepID=UPI001C027DA9|nr:sugar nucleotide-binding protein [Clostridium sp. MCC353]MBT9776286.1 sugar nucleotide-binding protein [Clostridium sp. MCC353]
MKILITGGNGFLGSRLIRRYEKCFRLYAPGRGRMDITDEEQVMREFHTFGPQAVIHCGAVSDTKACEVDRERSFQINVKGSGNIAQACRSVGAKLIFCSSDQVYSDCEEQYPHGEAKELVPTRTYARQKLEAERICAEINPDTVSLRLSWMYDRNTDLAREHGNLAASLLQHLAAGEKPSYPVFDYRSITNVWEVVDNLECALRLPAGVYNFGSENDKSTYEVASAMARALGAPEGAVLKDHESFAKRPRNLRMDISKIQGYGIRFLTTTDGIEAAFKI